MILKFPDPDTLRLALTSGAVPPAVALTAAVAGIDDQNQVWVEPTAPLPRAVQNDLRRLGVQVCKVRGAADFAPVSCWPEILPLRPDPDPIDRLEQTPILFETASQEVLGRLIVEILRLGNDRQGFRWLESKTDAGEGRGLLRVVGPPYYSLLRAIDRNGVDAPRAYRERAPRVWVEVGWTHPLADHLKPPAGKLLLASSRPPWSQVDEGPFRDVYEVMEFALPNVPSRWDEGELKAKVRAALKLTAGGSADGAELWVLRDDAVAELNRFVQNSDDQMLHRLAFAVGGKDGRTVIVLRVRHSKLPPPELVLKAEAYKPYLKLPNLFMPAGRLLHPPLRRDMVRQLLAGDPAQVVWLAPLDGGAFRPETLPEDAFRPLIDWIDYVLDHEKESLHAWVQAAQFDFEAFICDEDAAGRPKKPPAAPDVKRGKKMDGGDDGAEMPSGPMIEYVDKSRRNKEETQEEAFTVEKVEPSVLQQQLRQLEERFTAMEGGLDSPERQALWPTLANLNAALGQTEEAGVCWANALWGQDAVSEEWAWNWFRTEAAAVPMRSDKAARHRSWASRISTAAGKGREIAGEDLDRLLALAEPAAADLRALAAYVVWSAARESTPPAILQRLNQVQRLVEANEKLLPVRAAWLAWVHLTRGDVLALARARDRLLERLYHNGLRPEQDLPSFLRFAGQTTSQRFRGVGQWLARMAEAARDWIGRQGMDLTTQQHRPQTREYSDLLFAFGLARLGEHDAALTLLRRAGAVLAEGDDAHQLLFAGLDYRVRQALDGKPHGGPLPDEQMEMLELLRKTDRRESGTHLHYVVDRLRDTSRVLEPHQKVEPYRYTFARISEIENALAELPDVLERKEVADRVHALFRGLPKGATGNTDRHRVVRTALDQAPRVGEEFSREMLDLAVAAYDASESNDPYVLDNQAKLLQRALFVAAHFDRVEHIRPLVARFRKLLQSQRDARNLESFDVLVSQCFRGLRKLGMREEVDLLMTQTAEALAGGREVRESDAVRDPVNHVLTLRALLFIAAGWLYFGRERQAEPVMQAARTLLYSNQLLSKDQTPLACAYAAAVGQWPVETAQKRFEELFSRLESVRDAFTTNGWYSQAQLKVIEAVVLAVASDDFTLGVNARRWLDDDEYLVRRRVHKDYRALTAHA